MSCCSALATEPACGLLFFRHFKDHIPPRIPRSGAFSFYGICFTGMLSIDDSWHSQSRINVALSFRPFDTMKNPYIFRLTRQYKYETSESHMSSLSTLDVVNKLGISRATLERWLSSGKVRGPKTVRFGKSEFRNWTDSDVERVRRYKQENYRKGRGRKPKPKR
jgi:predicted DNA-binding transcriptional regulator AlpA